MVVIEIDQVVVDQVVADMAEADQVAAMAAVDLDQVTTDPDFQVVDQGIR